MDFTENDWEKEKKESVHIAILLLNNYQMNGGTLPCPKCSTVGLYYGGYELGDRKYRMCKFCGFVQDVDGEERDYDMYFCEDCEGLQNCEQFTKDVVGRDWGSGGGLRCQQCGTEISNEVTKPTEDENHPFREIIRRIQRGLIADARQ